MRHKYLQYASNKLHCQQEIEEVQYILQTAKQEKSYVLKVGKKNQ